MAQVQSTKVRNVPTVEGDTVTEFSMLAHLTDSAIGTGGLVPGISDTLIDNVNHGAYVEYQIMSPIGAVFVLNLLLGAENGDVQVNVGIYKTETEAWPADGLGDTVLVAYTGIEDRQDWYVFPFSLESGEIYTMRISFLNSDSGIGVCNLHKIMVYEATCCSYSSILSDLRINGTTISGFDPEITSYNLTIQMDEWVDSIGATCNDTDADYDLIEYYNKEGCRASYIIIVRSDFGFVLDYRVNVFTFDAIDYDKVRILPTVEGDVSTEFLMLTHLVDSTKSTSGMIPNITDTLIDFSKRGAYVEYQIVSPDGGYFAVVVNAATARDNAQLNVGVYNSETEFWPQEGLGETLDIENTGDWDSENLYYFPIYIEAGVYYNLRVNFINSVEDVVVCNIRGIEVVGLGRYNYYLSDLQINGTTLPDFDPEKETYNIAVPVGATSVNISATADDPEIAEVIGTGDVDITGFITTDTLTVELLFGPKKDYILNLYTPIEVTNGLELAMEGDLFQKSGVSVTDSLMTDFNNDEYVAYYIYSATDKDVIMRINATNGNRDNIYSQLNISNYTYGSEWIYNDDNSYPMTRVEMDNWSDSVATDNDFYLSLQSDDPVVLRLYGVTNAPQTLADIYSLTFFDDNINSIAESASIESSIKVLDGFGSLTVLCDEASIGSTVQIFDISGRLIINELINSTGKTYNINQSGVYVVKTVNITNDVATFKCIVK
jgi:hypothetical protein